MTNSSRILLIAIALFVLGTAMPIAALAKGPPVKDIKVEEAIPNFAEQGETGKSIILKGRDFPAHARVKFIYSDDQSMGDVTVVQEVVQASSKSELRFDINVPGEADLGAYDIEVEEVISGRPTGRKGKGTTLFSVQEKSNQNFVHCTDHFAPNGTCNCEFNWDVDTNIYYMLGNCKTSETLWLDGDKIWASNPSAGNLELLVENCTPDPEGQDCLDGNGLSFAGGFLGDTVFANERDVAMIRYLDIRFASGVVRGCSGGIRTAVSFILDGSTYDTPDLNSFLQIWNSTIDSWEDPLCTAIEVIRDPSFTTGDFGNKDWKVKVEAVEIFDGSYEEIGIHYEGMQPQQSVNPPLVWGNTIGAPACNPGETNTARAIQFGKILLSDPADPSSQIAGVVQSNTIRMATSCETPGGIGILVIGEPDQTTVDIVKNDISGAFVGVLIDRNVVTANLAGNKLTGVVDTGDIGVCTDIKPKAATRTKGKPNKINAYTDDFFFGGFPDEDYWCLEESSP